MSGLALADPRAFIHSIPPRQAGSRFLTGINLAGSPCSPTDSMLSAFELLIADRIARTPDLAPEPIELRCRRVALADDGTYRLVALNHPLRVIPSKRPFSHRKQRRPVGETHTQLFDLVLLGEAQAPQDRLEAAALQLAEENKIPAHQLSRLNNVLIRATCLSRGVVIDAVPGI